jgi:ribosomal protein S18
MIPDRLPEALREVIARFPPGTLQFEVGIQTFNPEVAERIRRRQNYEQLADNFRFLRDQTGVHIHADLIAGLPGETLESFAAGFDRLIALRPQEIQVGILKRLRGTPIARHDAEWEMLYSPHATYEVLRTKLIDFADMQKLRRFARYWDLVGNSGNFVEITPLLWSAGQAARLSPFDSDRSETGRTPVLQSPFHAFLRFSEWLHSRTGRTDSIALVRLMEFMFDYLTGELKLRPTLVAERLWLDYQRGGRNDKPAFLRKFLSESEPMPSRQRTALLKRQARHLSVE